MAPLARGQNVVEARHRPFPLGGRARVAYAAICVHTVVMSAATLMMSMPDSSVS